MPRKRDNSLATKILQLVVNNGGEILSEGMILEELALAFGASTETILNELVFLRRKEAIMTDRHRDGKMYGVYLLPAWETVMAELCDEALPIPPSRPAQRREVDVTQYEPVPDDPADSGEIDYPTLATHMLEQAGLAIEKARKADEILTRHTELIAEVERLTNEVRQIKASQSQVTAERDALLKQSSDNQSDNQMIKALTIGLEAAKEEVKRLRNEVIAAKNEIASLDNANRTLKRELNKARASSPSGSPLYRRLPPETVQQMNQLKRDLEGE